MKKVLILAMILNVSCGPSGPDFDEDHAFEYLLNNVSLGLEIQVQKAIISV